MIKKIFSRVKLINFKRKWRRENAHNGTYATNLFDASCVSVGKNTYGPLKVLNWGKKAHLRIGHYCSIAEGVTFLLAAEHHVNHVSTFPFKTIVLSDIAESFSYGDIAIGDDVWIGYESTILSGVKIGQGAIVAAGSVVTKDVPPYSIVGGVPAKVIKYRFEPKVIDALQSLDYSSLSNNLINDHINDLYSPIDHFSVEDIDALLKWFPRK